MHRRPGLHSLVAAGSDGKTAAAASVTILTLSTDTGKIVQSKSLLPALSKSPQAKAGKYSFCFSFHINH
jgi:hypothetical protein